MDLMKRPEPEVSPPLSPIEKQFAGLRSFHAVMAAHELSLFTSLKDTGDVPAIAREKGLAPHLCTLLCEALVADGFVKKEDGLFVLTEYSRTYLLPESPFYQGHALAFMRHLAGLWSGLSKIIRNGPIIFEKEQLFHDLIIPSMGDMTRCGLLQEVCSRVAAIPGFRDARSLLDLGGGHGLYAIAFTCLNPDLYAVVFDLPHVCKKTEEYIRSYQADRVNILPGDFNLDPLGSGYDIVFSSSNPGGKDPSLISKVAKALNPGGLYINKQASDDTPEDPLLDLEWNLWTFDGLQKKEERYHFEHSVSLHEYNELLRGHGFETLETCILKNNSTMVIARKSGD
jgi:hypothetical protein